MWGIHYLGRVRPEPQWAIPLHVHPDFHQTIVVLAGRIETQIAGQTIIGRAGDVLFYPLGEPHAERSIGPKPLETLHVSWTSDSEVGDRIPLLHRDRTGRITSAISWIEDMQFAGAADAVMLGLLAAIVHELTTKVKGNDDDAIVRVQRHVREHLAEPLALDDLAAVAGLSRFHFARVFKSRTGQSPATFVRTTRVEAARGLLETTPLPLREIAPRVGLADEYHLSRVFKKTTGAAPRSSQGRTKS